MSAQIVLLMAGLGSRFASEGYVGSKALIDVAGVPMFGRALSSLTQLQVDRVIGVVRQQQIAEESIDRRLREIVPTSKVIGLPGLTRGAAESAAAAAPHLDRARPVIVLDCDLWFASKGYDALIAGFGPQPQVALLTFAANDARYSYVRTDSSGRVAEIAEKRVISGRAVTGAYGFSSAALFLDAAAEVLHHDLQTDVGEAYMSEVVRHLLAAGVPAHAADVDAYASFGTPEELTAWKAKQGAPSA